MKRKVEYDELTEEYIVDLDDKTVAIIQGARRGWWARELCNMLNSFYPEFETINVKPTSQQEGD